MTATLGDLTQIPVTTVPTQGLPKLGDVSVTLYNQDITNVVYISYQQWFKPGAGNSVPIQPLTSITISAKRPIYVAGLVATLPLMVLPEGSQAQPSPAQIAAQINTLGLMKDTTGQTINTTTGGTTTAVNGVPIGIYNQGVPLVNKSTILLNSGAQVIAAAGTYAPAIISLAQPTVEVLVTLQNGAADTNPFVTLGLQWSDSTSGLTLEPDHYQLCCGTVAANPTTIHGILIAHGDRLTITIKNNGSTSCTATILVLNNSKSTSVDTELWRYLNNSQNINGFNVFGGGDIPTNSLTTSSLSLATGTTQSRLLPIYIGATVQVCIHTGSGLNDTKALIQIAQPIATALGLADNLVYQVQTNGSGNSFDNVWLPRAQCEIVVTNQNASTRTIQVDIVGTT